MQAETTGDITSGDITPVIIQARMTSSRLPGKVLTSVAGRPLLSYLVESMEHCRNAGPIVVASSVEPTDDPIADYCDENGIECFRGPLDDVMARFLLAVEALNANQFVRVCGDSPLLDHRLIDRAISLFWRHKPDLVTNLFP
ncbi:MAG: NTP transferase domain-containing protein, partial [Pseudomonadota bacterium]